MTKIVGTMQLALAVTMLGGAMAGAQGTSAGPVVVVPDIELQAHVVRIGFQAKDDLFGDTSKFANGASEVTEINLDPKSMSMVGQDHGRDGNMARRMKTMVIHTYKYDKPGMYRMEDVDAYRKKLEDGSWTCSIHVRNKNGATDICSRAAADPETNELVILTAEPQKLTFIHMRGNMSLGELDSMTNSVNGLSHRVEHAAPRPMAPTPPTPPAQPASPTPPVPPQ